MDNVEKIDLKEQLKSLLDTDINLSIGQIGAIRRAISQLAISKTEATSTRALGCWYCTGIESHGISTIKTVTDEYGHELPAYETPYNYCPNCGRRLEEKT